MLIAIEVKLFISFFIGYRYLTYGINFMGYIAYFRELGWDGVGSVKVILCTAWCCQKNSLIKTRPSRNF